MPARLSALLTCATVLSMAPLLDAYAPPSTRTWRSRVKEITPEGKEKAKAILRAVDPTDLFPGECTDLTLNITYRRIKVGADERPGPTREEHRQALQVLQQGYTTDRVVDVGLFPVKEPPSPAATPCELDVESLAPLDLGPDRLGVAAYTR
jgi:hypothetical protein